jgi:hypothetical protein
MRKTGEAAGGLARLHAIAPSRAAFLISGWAFGTF